MPAETAQSAPFPSLDSCVQPAGALRSTVVGLAPLSQGCIYVSVDCCNLLTWLAETRLARQAVEAYFRGRCRRHLARLDQESAARAQSRTLLGLLHRARATPFGRAHDFRRIRTAADFRRLVPLRTPAEFERPATPDLTPVPMPTALQAAHREALRTALALVVHARPQARLLAGRLLLLADGASGGPERVPTLLRPYTRAGLGAGWPGRPAPEAVGHTLAEGHAHEDVTCVAGPADRLVPFLKHVRELRGVGAGERAWPRLTALLSTRRGGGSVEALRSAAGAGVLLLETLFRPEGPVAVEDPRHRALRLLTDHGVYFEFVPARSAGEPHPPRLGLEEVEAGVPYELAVSSSAGLWACRVGLTVCLERLGPLLLHVLPPAPAFVHPLSPAGKSDVCSAAPPPPPPRCARPHRQSTGIPAALPERLVRSPWSIPADRG